VGNRRHIITAIIGYITVGVIDLLISKKASSEPMYYYLFWAANGSTAGRSSKESLLHQGAKKE
jgi:hypothetical protein